MRFVPAFGFIFNFAIVRASFPFIAIPNTKVSCRYFDQRNVFPRFGNRLTTDRPYPLIVYRPRDREKGDRWLKEGARESKRTIYKTDSTK